MKKLLLLAGAIGLSMHLAIAQSTVPGVNTAATYAYDDFQNVGGYTGTIGGNGGGIYWYSAGASNPNGARSAGSATFAYANAATTYLAVNFGNNTTFPLNLSSLADVEVDLENTGSDLLIRFFLTDINGKLAEVEPNLSDCIGVPNFNTPNPNATWTGYNMVYPKPADTTVVYPVTAFNGFVVPAGKRDTYRIDLSSVPTSVGGRVIGGPWWSGAPYGSPGSLPASGNFDITNVVSLTFLFNENGRYNDGSSVYNYSGKGLDTTSYKYDIVGYPAQKTWTGSLIFRSLKVGNILSPLGGVPTSTGTSNVTGLSNNDEAVDASLNAYPNPSTGTLNVSFQSGSAATVSLTDIVGNTAYTTSAVSGQNQITVNTSNLTKGIYILSVTTDQGVASRKISVQ
jgi:hypothetical protein